MKAGGSVPDDSALQVLEAALLGRRSVRSYRADPVPSRLIEAVLAAAACAPSPHHSAPWRFVVLTGPAERRRLADAMGAAWRRDLAADALAQERICILV